MAADSVDESFTHPAIDDNDSTFIPNDKDKSVAAAVTSVSSDDVEVQPLETPEKKYYSKLSVWLMILFSGLALGSDG